MSNYYTICWKCNQKIKTQSDSNYIKTRSGNFDLCPICYEEFIQYNSLFIQPERSKREELERSLIAAISDFHERIMEQEDGFNFYTNWGSKKVPPVVIHNGDWWRDCNACKEILSMRCSEHCGNTVREAQETSSPKEI